MQQVSERAPAKINLSLRVHGKRTDGFHEISSLVAFAGIADTVTVSSYQADGFSLSGPFSSSLTGNENLVEKAIALFRSHCPSAKPMNVELDKQLPVAAGLGGGSADAAATLRQLAGANPGALTGERLEEIAASLGSDVVVCLRSTASWMHGRGEKVNPITDFPPLPAVLVNPGVLLGAGEVYGALGAPTLADTGFARKGGVPKFSSTEDVMRYLGGNSNDLQEPATRLAPVIAEVISSIKSTQGCTLARMSGSGSSCFGIYGSQSQASQARRSIAEMHPDWWVVDTTLG